MTAPPSVENCQPIGGRLERVRPEAARVARLAFDTRLQRWLRRMLAHEVTVSPGSTEYWPMRLDVEAGDGRIQLGIDTTEWPALHMALELPDSECSCAVATVLLAPWAQALAGHLGHARVATRTRCRDANPHPALAIIATAAVRVAIHGVDGGLADKVSSALAGVLPGALSTFGHLRVDGRLRVLTRTFPTDVLFTLRPGDTVLLDANHNAANVFRMIYGKGVTMQFNSKTVPQTGALVATTRPALENEDSEGPDDGNTSISELQVPVAFEVDTARISLAELASMQPGYVIELDRPLAAALVRLVCHGQTVGHGQLVAVGDQMGVRIIRMGLSHDAAAKR